MTTAPVDPTPPNPPAEAAPPEGPVPAVAASVAPFKPVVLYSDAARLARGRHAKQLYGRKPYDYHLTQVVMNYPRFRDWDGLHDYLEDCVELNPEEVAAIGREAAYIAELRRMMQDLAAIFGVPCAQVVRAVTNPPGSKEPDYKLIRATSGALTVKLCDRIANVENSVSYKRLGRAPHKFFQKYVDQYPKFQAELRGRCRGEGAAEVFMWEQLDMLLSGARGPFE